MRARARDWILALTTTCCSSWDSNFGLEQERSGSSYSQLRRALPLLPFVIAPLLLLAGQGGRLINRILKGAREPDLQVVYVGEDYGNDDQGKEG
jgi:hypothetical protein